MRRRDQWIEWIRAVERQSDTAAYALELLEDQLRRDPSSLSYRGLGQKDFIEVAQSCEASYLVRLFAIHDESEQAMSISIAEARRFVCRFFSFLPEVW